jgi:excisionase family DNA binding protein
MLDRGTWYEAGWTELGSLLTITEAAALLRVSRSTVYRLLAERELPRIRVRGHSRIARADVIALIERRRVESIGPRRGTA